MAQEISFNAGRGRLDCQPKRRDCQHDLSACKQSLWVCQHSPGVSKHDQRDGQHADVAGKHNAADYPPNRSVSKHGQRAGKHAFSVCKQNDRVGKHRFCDYKRRTWNARFRDRKCLVSGVLTAKDTKVVKFHSRGTRTCRDGRAHGGIDHVHVPRDKRRECCFGIFTDVLPQQFCVSDFLHLPINVRCRRKVPFFLIRVVADGHRTPRMRVWIYEICAGQKLLSI